MQIVVLGLGSIGRRHAGNLVALGHRVVGYDTDEARLKAFEDSGGQTVPERTAALEKAANGGVVVISSPSGQHHSDVLDALARGSHIFVEKPFAHRLDGLEEALATAQRHGQVVFAAHNLRYNPVVESARALLKTGKLGRIFWARAICASYLPDWRPGQDYRIGYAADPVAGGVIFDVVHEFDLSAYLLGPFKSVQSVSRRSGHLDLPSEDVADILLDHDCGATTTLHFDYLTRPPLRVMDIAGEKGRIEIDIIGRRLVCWRADGSVVADETACSTLDEDYREEMDHFLECVAGKATPRCDGAEAIAALREVLKARAIASLPSAEQTT